MERYLSLKDHVYHYISERISSGELGAGDKINEQQIGEELNISRTPVREALIQLASDGYVDNFPRRGFYVKSLDIQKIQEFYEVIGILDGRAAVLCMEHLTNQDLEQMKLLANQMDRAIDEGHGDLYYELQVEFHDVYLRKCPNTEIFSLLKRLKDNFIRKYYLFEGPDNELEVLHDTNQQHYEIIRLFQEKKAAELECYIRDVHWDSKKAKFDILPSKQKKIGQSK